MNDSAPGTRHSIFGALLLAFVLACSALAQTAAAPSTTPIIYDVVLADPAHHVVRVSLTLPAGEEVRKLQLPVWNALYQVRDFSQFVLGVNAKSPTGQPLAVRKIEKSAWSVSGAAQGAIVTYDIFADAPGPFGAQFNPQHAFFNLAEVLMYPAEHAHDTECRITFEPLPASWKAAMPLPRLASTPDKPAFVAPSYDRLVDSPVELGTFAESDFQEGGATYRVVVDADPSDYDMTALTGALHKIVATETSWMGDRPFDEYTFLYHFPRTPAGGGMEHAYATAISTSAARIKDDPNAVAAVSAHEFFHLWNVKRIRPQSLEPLDYSQEMYTRALWFSEGVTSTVGDYTLLHTGFLDQKGYLRRLGQLIATLQDRPAHRTQSAEESSLDTWLEKYPFYRLPERSIDYYNKGEILGVLLDLEMRELSGGHKSLRDLFQYLNENYAKRGRFFDDSKGIEQAAEAVTGADFSHFFAEHVAGTVEIPYNEFFATVGLALRSQYRVVADLGFRATRNDGEPPVVTTVDAGGVAAAGGLMSGDIIEEVDTAPVTGPLEPYFAGYNPGETVQLRVRRAGKRRNVKIKLGGRQVHEGVLDDMPNITPQQRARREAWLKGEDQ